MLSCVCPGVELSSPHLELIWSNLLRIFKTSVPISSPPVCQITHIGNRFFMLFLQIYVLVLMYSFYCATVLWSHHGSTLWLSSPHGHPAILAVVNAPSPGKDSNTTPACPVANAAHRASWNSGQPSSLYSAHPHLHLLPLKAPLTPPAS